MQTSEMPCEWMWDRYINWWVDPWDSASMPSHTPLKKIHGLRYAKIYLMAWVVTVPILLLVWHRLFNKKSWCHTGNHIWQRLRTLGSFSRDAAHLILNTIDPIAPWSGDVLTHSCWDAEMCTGKKKNKQKQEQEKICLIWVLTIAAQSP